MQLSQEIKDIGVPVREVTLEGVPVREETPEIGTNVEQEKDLESMDFRNKIYCLETQEIKDIGVLVREETLETGTGVPVREETLETGTGVPVREEIPEIGTNVEQEQDLESMDFRNKIYCLELNVISEEINEDSRDKVINGMDNLLDWNDVMEPNIEKIYGINCSHVTMEKLSRDDPVYFEKKNRDMILQQYFSNLFRMDGKKIFGIEVIPIRLLLYDYGFDSKIIMEY
ncbi:uncharacterized protein LOC133382996 [Rhineura floridana]|uniref:uncharacterized protein LOC133382996 n=1 Tax=Rhineura floridana TaxID=261503 RepID=UPI002AC84063|nr:uncharacterized protein LOC133382996 [Rhineura floridana]XP_061478785.1 uncharacterized protein LOC133382996 [Rhineura floridana]